jgi:hypothetical protein
VPPGATIRRGEDGRAEIAAGGGGSPGAAVGCAFVPPSRVAPDLGQVALPDDGRLHTNPDHGDTHGVSGMESWFWWTGTAEVSWVSPVLPGVATDCALLPAPDPVSYRARITRWRYDVADSVPGRYVATAPGVAVDPLRPDGGEVAARHTYHTKGRWPAQVTCTWTVEGTVTGGVARPCGRRDLHVIEIRAASAEPGHTTLAKARQTTRRSAVSSLGVSPVLTVALGSMRRASAPSADTG